MAEQGAFENEGSYTECKLIADGAASEYDLMGLTRDVDLAKFTNDADVVNRLTGIIQSVASHIIAGLDKR